MNELQKIKIERNMLCHMALDTEHILKYEYTIITPDQFDNQRKFYSETITKKRKGEFGKFGKSETVFYIDLKGLTFKTITELLESLGLTI